MAERAAQITYPMSILDDRDRNELFGRIAGVETELKDSIADLDDKVEDYKAEHNKDVDNINKSIEDNVGTLNETIVNTQNLLQQNIDSNTADIEDNTNRIYANEKDIAEIEQTIATGAGMELDYEDSRLSLLASDGSALSTVTIVGGGVADNVSLTDDGAGNVEIVNGDVAHATGDTAGYVMLSDRIDSNSGADDGVAATPLAVSSAATAVLVDSVEQANAYTDEKIEKINSDINNIGDVIYLHTHTPENIKEGTFTGSYDVNGDLSINGYAPMLGSLDDEYYGMRTPTGSDTDFIRTTYAGIIPYDKVSGENGNTSVLGTEKWPFKRVVTNSLMVNGRTYGENQILWEGAKIMNDEQTITFTQSVSNQPNGIVLVFSYYETNEGESSPSAQDHSWSTHFVPKIMVELNNGGAHTFLMAINSALKTFGAKYLNISDTGMSGHASNGYNTTSDCGITISNNFYVLRYVIGV